MIPDLSEQIGREVAVTRWFTVDQPRISAFADVTEDHQFLHVDPDRAAQTPFGGTVAHGFLTLSLLSAMSYDALPPLNGRTASVNYGFDRLRFVSPVRAGSRVRGRFALLETDTPAPDTLSLTHDVTVEVEGADKPALVARWITRHYFDAKNEGPA